MPKTKSKKSRSKTKQYRNFMSTHYNYDMVALTKCFSDKAKIKCYAYQEEVCPKTKKAHVQSYYEFKQPRSIAGVKKYFKDISLHVETRKGTKVHAITYCTKTESRKPGTLPITYNVSLKGGRRPLLESYVNGYINGTINDKEFNDKYPVYFINSMRKLRDRRDEVQDIKYMGVLAQEYDSATLRPWQITALTLYLRQTNREILWIYDKVGNTGKTWLAKYIYVKFKNVFLCDSGKATDILYAYKKQPFVVYDLTRSQEEFINYVTMEQFKNGKAFSSKYHSKTIIFTPSKVIVFANYSPLITALSLDRWVICKIHNKKLYKKLIVSKPLPVRLKKGGKIEFSSKELNKEIESISSILESI